MRCDTAALRAVLDVSMTQDRDATFTPTDTGWRLVSASADKVTLVFVDIPRTVLSDGPEPFTVEAAPFSQALSHSPEAEVTVQDGRVTVRAGDMDTVLPLVTVTAKVPNVPSLPSGDAVAVVESQDLLRLSRASSGSGDAFRFTMADVGLTVSAVDSEGLGVTLTLPASSMATRTLSRPRVSSAYPRGPWQAFLRSLPRDTTLELSWSGDYPMAVAFAWQGVDGTWLAAPLIEEML